MLPLAGRRVLVTRARGQASALAAALESLGASTILIPTIEIAPPHSWCALDAALSSIRAFDWVIFTSANAVAASVTRARTLKLDPAPRRVAAIGPATARAVVEAGMTLDLIPPQAVAESLAEALRPHAAGAAMLLVRAAEARDVLPETLTAAGATLTVVEAYRNVIPEDSIQKLRELFASKPPDAVTFTSASTAQNLVALLNEAGVALPQGVVLASIGPITSAAMRELELDPRVEAREATVGSLAAALAAHYDSAG